MRALGMPTWAAYAARVASDSAELARLKERLTVHVTEFLRDPDVWEILRRDHMPELIRSAADSPGREFRAWSAGCSSGEEAYALGMLALEAAHSSGRGVKARILGSDVEESVLRKAREGCWPDSAMAAVPEEWKAAFLERGNGAWSAGADLKRTVSFRGSDLFSAPPPQGVHLLLCRNVMIYFSRGTQQRLLAAFHQALIPGGLLVTGKTETILGPVRERYRCRNAAARIFQKN